MLSSLLRSKKRRRTEHSPFSSAFDDARSDYQHLCEDDDNDDGDNDDTESVESSSVLSAGDEENENNPLLPIFSAAQLGTKSVSSRNRQTDDGHI
jgi:hypothetical protein